MKAIVVEQVGKVSVQEVPNPELKSGHVLLAVKAISICGTDLHIASGHITATYPRITGHDFAGVIAEVGPGVTGFKPGDRVAVKPSFPCGTCVTCSAERMDLCENKKLIGLHRDGCMMEYIAVPACNLVPMPDEVTFAQAATLEPFTVALNTFQRVKINVGETVVVLGQGPIGLGQTRLAALAGAGEVIGVDIRPCALEMATRFGATVTINAREEDVVARVKDLTGGKGADVVIEAAGAAQTVAMQLELVRKEGKVVNVGFQVGMGSHPVGTILMKTLTVFGVGGNGGRGQYETAIELVRKGVIHPEWMLTHTLPFVQGDKAFVLGLNPPEGLIKILLEN